LPEGDYTATNLRLRTEKGFVDPQSFGWSVDLSDKGGREYLRIHPDQAPRGTRGCIGIQGCAAPLYYQFNQYFQTNSYFIVQVKYAK
jgi:hypothetical protein